VAKASVALYPGLAGQADNGLPTAVWDTVYAQYIDVMATSEMLVSTIGRRSDAPGLGVGTPADGLYLAVVGGVWMRVRVDDPLPDPTQLPAQSLLEVVSGAWTPAPMPYQLPGVIPEGGWMVVVNGVWRSYDLAYEPLPTVTAYDENAVLTVANGVWVKGDGDNFYLPMAFAITPEVPHAVTVAGSKWLKRPFSTATVTRRGTVPPLPGDPAMAFHGDGAWRGVGGDDYGRWRLGDIRVMGSRTADGWLPLDGGTIGRLDGADHHGARYYSLYMLLHPDADDWENGVAVALDDLPGHEILAASRQKHPSLITVFAGPAAGGPYLLQIADSADFSDILFQSDSAADRDRWREVDGVLACDFGGTTLETYSRFAEPKALPAATGTGFFHTRCRGSDGVWAYGKAWATEEDVLRLDTVVSAGSVAAGVAARAPAFRQQLPVMNGRPMHAPYVKSGTGEYGTVFSTDTSSRNGDRFLHDTPVTNNPNYKTPDPTRMDAFRGVEMRMYGAGDMAIEGVATVKPEMRSILDQLKTLDGYSAAATPKCRLVRLEHGIGKRNWWGGAVGADGNIYMIPYFNKSVLIIEPKTGRIRTRGNYTGNHGRWSGGVLAPNGILFCFPYNNERFLLIDTNTGQLRRSTLGLPANVIRGSIWAGGCLNFDGTIRAFPLFGWHELVIDWANERATAYDTSTVMPEIYSDVSRRIEKYKHPLLHYAQATLSPNEAKWGDTQSHVTPRAANTWSHINLDDISTPWAGAHNSVTQKSLYGGAVMGSDGVIRAVPCGTWLLERLRLDYHKQWYPDLPKERLLCWSVRKHEYIPRPTPFMPGTAVSASMYRLADYDMYDPAAGGYVEPPGRGDKSGEDAAIIQSRVKYLGGVLAPDGNNYFIPCGGGPDVLVAPATPSTHAFYDPPSVSFRVSDPRYANCRGGVLGPDGNIYSASADGTAAFALTPRTRQLRVVELNHPKFPARNTAWMGAVTGPDGWVYFVPYESEYLLIVDPCVASSPWPSELNQYLNKF
jgi:hypothetical protein